MESFKYIGFWWLSDEPDNQIPGTLSFSLSEGGILELNGSFKKTEDAFNVSKFSKTIILGTTRNGIDFTLYKCHEVKSSFSFPGYPIEVFKVAFIFRNCHFENESGIKFKELSISYNYLAEWLRKSGFVAQVESDKKEGYLKRIDVSYEYPEQIEYEMNQFKIILDYHFKSDIKILNRIILEQANLLTIVPSEPLQFDDYLESIIYKLQNFLSLAVGRAVYPTVINGRNDNYKINSAKGKTKLRNISIYYHVENSFKEEKIIDSSEFLFLFSDIKDDLPKYINNWFEKSITLKPIYDLYFGIIYNPKSFITQKFLNLIQAIESYHRRLYKSEYIDDRDFKEVKKELCDAIPSKLEEDFKSSLKQRIAYLNELSLRDRLINICEQHKALVSIYIKDIDGFIKDTVNTRNYLTHFDKKLEKRAKHGIDLYRLNQKLRFFLEMLLLLELELSEELIKQILKRNLLQRFPEVKKVF